MAISGLPLSYCSNVHPGRTVADVNSGLSQFAAEARSLCGFPVAAGLWLGSSVAEELCSSEAALESLAQTLWQHDLSCFTLNTFPFGDFHGDRVKEQVYLPDWASHSRLRYTQQCAEILSKLLPPGAEGSLSTVPLGGLMNPQTGNFRALCNANLIQMARFLKSLHDSTGRLIRLGLEPEPFCELSGTRTHSLPVMRGLYEQADVLGCESLVREYIGLCFDVCHQAVEFEDAAQSIRDFVAAGVRINKVHITNALALERPAENQSGRDFLCSFAEPRYLHQTFARFSDGSVQSRVDLLQEDLRRDPADHFLQADEWRVHFHVPIFAEALGPLKTTRVELAAALRQVARLDYAPHLEVETYTWPVMPGESATSPESLGQRISRELESAAELLAAAE